MNKVMNTRFILLYFFAAVFASTIAYFLPLYFVNQGFNPTQVGILNSIGIAAAIVSPIFGMMAEKKYSTKGVMIFNSCIAFSALGMLYFAESFAFVFVLAFIYALFQNPLYSFNDLYVTSYTNKYNLNYGHFRRFTAFGWGVAVFIALPFIYVFGLNGFIIAGMLFIGIYLYFLSKSEDCSSVKKSSDDVKYGDQVKLLLKNNQFVLLLAFACLFWGISRVRMSYQSLLFNEFISSDILIAISCFLAITPEIIFLPMYPRLQARFKFGGLMTMAMVASTTLLLIFAFVENGYVLAFANSLHGFMALIYFPTIIFGIRKAVPASIMVTAMLIVGAAMSIVSFAVSIFIITPVFANFGVQPIFFVLAVLSMLALYPLYKLRNLEI